MGRSLPPIEGLGQRIARHRERLGWSLEKVADLCGVSRQAIEAVEKGKNNPSIATLMTIADAFGVSVDALLGRKAR
jgi:transcriptional regulator with XRE-family HTH domain